jgi:PleD family two-component response regulator
VSFAPRAQAGVRRRCSRSNCRSPTVMVSNVPTPLPHDEPDAGPRRLRVFVGEDHQDTRNVLCLLLEMLGHEVVAARSIQEALINVPNAHCDVLLTNIGL